MTPRLRLLGRARVSEGQQWLEAPHDKRFALLVYLALSDDWVGRDKLALLLWPEVEEARAKNSLRSLVYRVRALSFAANLEVQPGSLRWRAETDVQSLCQAAERREWAAAVALYGGELLQGWRPDGSPEFSAWLELERHKLHNLWRRAALGRAAQLESASKYGEAAILLKTLMEHDEFDEDALQQYLRAAFLDGQREAALRAYRRFRDTLRAELGLEPQPATKELVQALRSALPLALPLPSRGVQNMPGGSGAAVRTSLRLRNFPPESTTFIGRDLELADIINTLSRPDCRLLSLVGPGGVGKTRLAQKAAVEVANSYDDGATFVPLAPVSGASFLASAIASALSFSFHGQGESEAQLHGYLHDKEMLLVLDNCEHLLDGGGLIKSLLETCPRLKVLATSRERLHLASESLLHIGGMSLPENEQALWSDGFDAPQLFLRRARQIRADFMPVEEDRVAVVHICRYVGGAPLGIELAAGWAEVLSCKEIAEEIKKDFDILASSLHDVPERHQSLRRVFEQSWRLLSATERTAFKRLSVFRGGFTRKAAQAVADVSMRALLALVTKSLIKRNSGGRFDLHELVKQYATERLGDIPEEEHVIRSRHCSYYAAFLHEREHWLRGGERQQASLQEVESELDNVRVAWRWASQRRELAALERASSCLRYFYQIRGLYQEAEEAFRLAADNLVQESVALGKLLLFRGLFTWWLGRYDEAEALVARSLSMLTHQRASPEVMANAHHLMGLLYLTRGVLDSAEYHIGRALILARKGGELFFESRALHNLGKIAMNQGASDRAGAYYREGITLFRQANDRAGLSMALGDLGSLLEKLGQTEAARKHYLESLAASRAIGATIRMSEALFRLGKLSHLEGHFEQAEVYYTEGLALVEERERETNRIPAERWLLGLGESTHALQKFWTSFNHFHAALRLTLSLNDRANATRSLVGLAEVLRSIGDPQWALALLVFALDQPEIDNIDDEVRERAERLCGDLELQLPEAVVAEAQMRGRTLQLEAVVDLLINCAPDR